MKLTESTLLPSMTQYLLLADVDRDAVREAVERLDACDLYMEVARIYYAGELATGDYDLLRVPRGQYGTDTEDWVVGLYSAEARRPHGLLGFNGDVVQGYNANCQVIWQTTITELADWQYC